MNRFTDFTQHEQSILYELLKEPNLSFQFLDAQPILKDQHNPHESTRIALLQELES